MRRLQVLRRSHAGASKVVQPRPQGSPKPRHYRGVAPVVDSCRPLLSMQPACANRAWAKLRGHDVSACRNLPPGQSCEVSCTPPLVGLPSTFHCPADNVRAPEPAQSPLVFSGSRRWIRRSLCWESFLPAASPSAARPGPKAR